MPDYTKWKLPELEQELDSARTSQLRADKWVEEVEHAISVVKAEETRNVGAIPSNGNGHQLER